MTARTLTASAATLAAAGALALPTAAFAANGPTCDAYSRHCTNVEGHKITKPPTEVAGEKATLPFTGGEIVLMTLAGAGAIAGGTAFVVAGRRRRQSPAS